MIVCIAEKPSVARDIAAVLGATANHNGYMEGNGYQVTWTFGHLCELKEPHEYSPLWKAWTLGQLPMIPTRFGIKLKNDDGIKRQFAVIEKLMSEAEGIINCGDAGQEGELIQRWVMQKAGAKCPVRRLWISSLTEESIREGFEHLKPQADYQSLYEAGLCRAIGDWLLGMNATRLYTQRYGRDRQVLSVGRVQTPTLALIVARQKEIENFKPEPYWVLTTVYRDTTFTAVMEEGARGFKTKEEGAAAMAAIKDLPFTVTSVEQKKGTEAPPRLFDLTSLQVECNKKFGYSAEVTLGLIQSLYEKKYTTYPRVDTTFLTDDIYAKCPTILKGLVGYEQFTAPLIAPPPQSQPPLPSPQGGRRYLLSPSGEQGGGLLKKSKKVFDNSKVTDHHAIIPTGVPAHGMTDMEKNVYNLVALRFIAVFYPDCKFVTTTVLGQVGEGAVFRVTGKRITDPGWRTVFGKQDTAEDSTSPLGGNEGGLGNSVGSGSPAGLGLPLFKEGESGPHEPNLAEKTTTPPKPYTEATLLRAMETAGRMVEDEELRDALKENGIGRPSTRAAIIETLFRRKYIERARTTLRATTIGVSLIDTIRNELLKSAELTGQWERKLRQIEKHEYSATQFIDELKVMVTDLVNSVMREPQVVEGCVCPACGQGAIIRGRTALGCSRWKEGCQFRAPLP